MARILFLGDIVGKAGRTAVIEQIGRIRETERLDLVVVNGENAAGGSGINREIAEALRTAGVDAITLGDHVWDQRGWEQDIGKLDYVIRPFNLPKRCPGADAVVVEGGGYRLGVLTCLGQQFMKVTGGNGFEDIHERLQALRARCDGVLVEMHAETTSEKVAMGWYMDGMAVAVIGTHTHIPTGDARILPRGTGYLTDAGMCGPYDSVLGRDIQPVIARFVDGMPRRFTVAEANVQLHGALFEVQAGERGCQRFERWSLTV